MLDRELGLRGRHYWGEDGGSITVNEIGFHPATTSKSGKLNVKVKLYHKAEPRRTGVLIQREGVALRLTVVSDRSFLNDKQHNGHSREATSIFVRAGETGHFTERVAPLVRNVFDSSGVRSIFTANESGGSKNIFGNRSNWNRAGNQGNKTGAGK